MELIYFAGTWYSGGVFLSTNNGTIWKQVGLNSAYVNSIAVSGTRVFAGTQGGGVYLTTDDGKNWRQVNDGLTNSNPIVNSLHLVVDIFSRN